MCNQPRPAEPFFSLAPTPIATRCRIETQVLQQQQVTGLHFLGELTDAITDRLFGDEDPMTA